MKTSRSSTTSSSNAESQAQTTAGELFGDGSAIELVTTDWSNGDELGLLFWNGERALILPQVDYRGRAYRPVRLHPSILQAIRLPSGAADYGSPGELFDGVASLFQRSVGFSKPEAMVITLP